MPGKPDNVLGSGDLMPSLPGSREKEARGARQRPRGSAITVHVNEFLGLQPRRESSLAQPRASRDHPRQPVGASAEDGALLEPVAPSSLPPGQHRASRWKVLPQLEHDPLRLSRVDELRFAMVPKSGGRTRRVRQSGRARRIVALLEAVAEGHEDECPHGMVQRSSWVSWIRLPLTPTAQEPQPALSAGAPRRLAAVFDRMRVFPNETFHGSVP
jgi:hypothetical protein